MDDDQRDRAPDAERETRRPDLSLFSRGVSMDTWINERDDRLVTNSTIGKRVPDGDDGWRSTNVFNEQDLPILMSHSMQTTLFIEERKREWNREREHDRSVDNRDQSRERSQRSRSQGREKLRDRRAR